MTLCNGVFTVIRCQQVMFFKMLWLIAPYIPLRCRLKWRSPPSCSWRRRCSLLFAWRECCRCHPFWFCNPEYRNKKIKAKQCDHIWRRFANLAKKLAIFEGFYSYLKKINFFGQYCTINLAIWSHWSKAKEIVIGFQTRQTLRKWVQTFPLALLLPIAVKRPSCYWLGWGSMNA